MPIMVISGLNGKFSRDRLIILIVFEGKRFMIHALVVSDHQCYLIGNSSSSNKPSDYSYPCIPTVVQVPLTVPIM